MCWMPCRDQYNTSVSANVAICDQTGSWRYGLLAQGEPHWQTAVEAHSQPDGRYICQYKMLFDMIQFGGGSSGINGASQPVPICQEDCVIHGRIVEYSELEQVTTKLCGVCDSSVSKVFWTCTNAEGCSELVDEIDERGNLLEPTPMLGKWNDSRSTVLAQVSLGAIRCVQP